MSGKFQAWVGAALAGLMVSMVSPANAGLIGDSITASGDMLGPATATVGSGIEFTGVMNYLKFDFGASTLTISNVRGINWGGFATYTFGGFDDIITGMSLLSNTGYSGDIIGNYSFDAHSIMLDMDFGKALPNGKLVFSLSTAPAFSTQAIPEPETLALFAAALAGMALARHKRN